MHTQTLSVVIPNYNHGKFLKDQLLSLLSQDRPPDEIVIVDDGSTDDSVKVIREIQKNHSSIRLFENGVNRGVLYSLNFAVKQAVGEFLTFPSSDNIVLPGMYRKCLQMFTQYPQAVICCSDPLYLNQNSGQITSGNVGFSKVPCYFSPEQLLELTKKKGLVLGNLSHTVVVKKSALSEVGNQNEFFLSRLRWHCDFFAWNAVAFRYGTCYIPEGLAVFRESPDSYSQKRVALDERKRVYKELFSVLDLPENKDIKEGFKKSAVLKEFWGGALFSVMISSTKYYEYFTRYFIYIAAYIWGYYSIRNVVKKIPYARKIYRALKRKNFSIEQVEAEPKRKTEQE